MNQSKETLNEEKIKQAQKEARTRFSFTIYMVSPKTPEGTDPNIARKYSFVEAERFIDARTFACRLLGVPEVDIQPHTGEEPVMRWQVRYAGNAAGANTVRMQSRRVTRDAPEPQWTDTREL